MAMTTQWVVIYAFEKAMKRKHHAAYNNATLLFNTQKSHTCCTPFLAAGLAGGAWCRDWTIWCEGDGVGRMIELPAPPPQPTPPGMKGGTPTVELSVDDGSCWEYTCWWYMFFAPYG